MDIIELIIKVCSHVNMCELLNDKLGNDETPLHLAIKPGNEKVVGLLLRAKVDCSLVDTGGNSPLHLAVKNNLYNMVEQLLQFGHKMKEVIDKHNNGKLLLFYIN